MKLGTALTIVTQYVPKGQSKEISKTATNQGLSRTSWSIFALSLSPNPTDHRAHHRSLGEKVRFIDLLVPPRSSGGIIDNPPADVDPQEFSKQTAQDVERLVLSNFGHLFPGWIRVLLSTDLSDELIGLTDLFVERGVQRRILLTMSALLGSSAFSTQWA